MTDRPTIISFDVESIGLHGEGYAVGWVRFYRGEEVEHGVFACPPEAARGTDSDREWCAKNIPPIPPTHATPREVREAFWQLWREANHVHGAMLVADCAWPVEARFLAACVDDRPEVRCWQGPYPLHDVATARLMAGLDPLADARRYPEELPKHDPVCDARQSGRLFLEAWDRVGR